MDFGFSPEQDMLRQTARAFLADNCPPSLVRQMLEDERGYQPELWKEMAELGWLGLAFPEEYGGQGLGFVDLTVILEEMGAVLLPSPFFRVRAVSWSDDTYRWFRNPEKSLPPAHRRWLLDCHAGHDGTVRAL